VNAIRSTIVAGAVALVASPARPQTTTKLLSLSSSRRQGDADSWAASIDPDGRYATFTSLADNLVFGDVNGADDVFVHDLQTGLTELVSVDSSGVQGNNNSSAGAISRGGRFVAFTSWANNLVAADTNGVADVFVRDRKLGTTRRMSETAAGVQANSDCTRPVISADGRFVAFSSKANNLVPNDWNADWDVFVRDAITGTLECASLAQNGMTGNSMSGYDAPAISGDGRYVAFESFASNLVSGDTNSKLDVFVRNLRTGFTKRVSVDSAGIEADDPSLSPSISADGRFVAFQSYATNLVTGDTNQDADIFVHDLGTSVTERASVDSAGVEANYYCNAPAISADGQVVAFESTAYNLVGGDTNWANDVFVHDRSTGVTERVSVDPFGREADNDSFGASLSGNGRIVTFTSYSDRLVPGDRNGYTDAIVRIR
jgi:hypothetical protein